MPRSHLQADLDLVAPASAQLPTDALLAEAEALKAVTEVLERLPDAVGSYEIRLSHRSILEASLALIGVPKVSRFPLTCKGWVQVPGKCIAGTA